MIQPNTSTPYSPIVDDAPIVQRSRAILLTGRGTVLFIKRVKHDAVPYWVAPGGGVEGAEHPLDSLHRELMEELGARVDVLVEAFVLRHFKAGKNLEEHFYICRLQDYDLDLRSGPEFNDPARGEFLPDEVRLDADAIAAVNMRTPELRDWMIAHLGTLSLHDAHIRAKRHGISGQTWLHTPARV